MKIKKLTMKAFGSYGTATTLDYSDLQDGLYLIRGKTGAGKTTIFDAIMIALYGEASGERRDFAMFHSDFVPKSVDSEVELEFEHKGGTHRVRRVQHFRNTRGTDEYVPVSPEAMFWEDGKPVIEKATIVTERIKKLIGLTAAQFRQIVMLAQGDFRKFLDAKSDDRGAILRQIFDTSDYRGVTERLCAAYGKLKEEREGEKRKISVLIENMVMPDGVTEDERAKLNADHPELLLALADLVTRETASARALAETDRESADKLRKLTTARATAEIRNGQLEELESARKLMSSLEGKKDEMAEREAVREKALRSLPAKRAMEAANSRAEDLTKQEEKLQQEESKLNDLQQKKDAAEAERQALGYDEGSVAKLNNELAQLQPLQDDFTKLEESQGEKAKLDRKIQDKKTRIDELVAESEAAKKDSESLAADLEDLGNPEREKAKAEASVSECEHRLRDLETLQQNVNDIERSLVERKANLLARAREMLGQDAITWEELAAGEGIHAAQTKVDEQKKSAEAGVRVATDKCEQQKVLKRKLAEAQEKVAQLEKLAKLFA